MSDSVQALSATLDKLSLEGFAAISSAALRRLHHQPDMALTTEYLAATLEGIEFAADYWGNEANVLAERVGCDRGMPAGRHRKGMRRKP